MTWPGGLGSEVLDGTLMSRQMEIGTERERAGPMPSNKAGSMVTSEFLRQKA